MSKIINQYKDVRSRTLLHHSKDQLIDIIMSMEVILLKADIKYERKLEKENE